MGKNSTFSQILYNLSQKRNMDGKNIYRRKSCGYKTDLNIGKNSLLSTLVFCLKICFSLLLLINFYYLFALSVFI